MRVLLLHSEPLQPYVPARKLQYRIVSYRSVSYRIVPISVIIIQIAVWTEQRENKPGEAKPVLRFSLFEYKSWPNYRGKWFT